MLNFYNECKKLAVSHKILDIMVQPEKNESIILVVEDKKGTS
jgi:hypothetical protein